MIGYTVTRNLARVLLTLTLVTTPLVALADIDGSDTDLDSVSDDEDNCPLDFNPDQLDADNDGSGDLCDSDSADLAG